jgi:hypothetical protein
MGCSAGACTAVGRSFFFEKAPLGCYKHDISLENTPLTQTKLRRKAMKGNRLWAPSKERIESTNLYRFMKIVNERYGKDFKDYPSLYQWSVEAIPDFWAAMWDVARVKASKPYTRVIDDVSALPGAKWFEGAELNFAENLLRYL